MVSGGTVSSDLATLSNSFSSYTTSISNLSSVWQGDSYTNLVTQAEQFVSEYKAAITKQMNAFASALSSYEEYKTTKNLLAQAEAAYAQAEANQDSSMMSSYASQINQYRTKLEQLKSAIEASLAEASTPTLAASAASGRAVNLSALEFAAGSSVAVQQAISTALELTADDTHGYSQKTRWGNPNYDCSSFVITCWDSAGTGVKNAGASYTGNMIKGFTSTGLFIWIPGDPKVEDLQPGDVVLNPNSHTELYIGNGKLAGARGDLDGRNGDSSGKELGIFDYRRGWQGVLRYVGDQNVTLSI